MQERKKNYARNGIALGAVLTFNGFFLLADLPL